MNCPECKNSTLSTLRVYSTKDSPSRRLPPDLRGVNVKRRMIVCPKCGHRFFTIEMEETAFNSLRRPRSLLPDEAVIRETEEAL